MNEGGYSREVSLNRGGKTNEKNTEKIKERYTATTSPGTSTTHSGTATTRPGTVTIYSDSYNLTLTDRDGGCERRLGRDAVKCSVFFSAVLD